MVLEFNCQESVSIKSFAVKQSNHVKLTTRFLSGKMLIFAKLYLMYFIYEMLETFCFPDKKVRKIFKKYQIEKVHIYHVLTDTDSTCLKFLFVSYTNSDIPESKYRDIIFEVIIASEICNRFGSSSHEYWQNFNARKENLRKCLGYFEIEHIDDPCILTITCNPKEFFEMFVGRDINKKRNGIKKRSTGLGFESFLDRITSLINFDTFKKPPPDFKQVSRLTVSEGEMQKKTVIKSKFSQINDKRIYFEDGITSLPLSHPHLQELIDFKTK